MTANRIDELAAAWSADDPDPLLRAELEERLLQDPAARRQFIDHCVAEMALVESLASVAKAADVTNADVTNNVVAQGAVTKASKTARQTATGKRKPLRLHDRGGAQRSTTRAIALWASGLAALLFIGIMLISQGDALRVTTGSLIVDGRTIPVGGQVTLPLTNAKAGSGGVELDDQAGIVLRAQPDSMFAISAPGGIRLNSGKITLEVDGKRAPPTAVRTDELLVSVVGTGFGVARNTTKTEVDVQHGQVRVTTPDNAVRDLTAGMRVAADESGFIRYDPPNAHPPQPDLRLLLIAEDKTQRVLDLNDQPLRIPAERPFFLRAEVSSEVVALGYRLSSTKDYPARPRRVEATRPFDLWGDVDRKPTFSTVPAGTHQLTIIFYADESGEQQIGTRHMTLIAE